MRDIDSFLAANPEWSETQLAQVVDCNQSTINRIRRRQRHAGLALLMRLEAATDGGIRAEDLHMTERTREALRAMRAGARATARKLSRRSAAKAAGGSA